MATNTLGILLSLAAQGLAASNPKRYREIKNKSEERRLARIRSIPLGEVTPVAHGGGKPWAGKKSKKKAARK